MNSDGVSEVVGIILLVAVTVIIAAIIASYTFGLPAQVDNPKSIAATVDKTTSGNFFITYHGGSGTSTVSEIRVYNDGDPACTLSTQPGSTCEFPDLTPMANHIIVVAIFSDDSDPQIILDQYL